MRNSNRTEQTHLRWVPLCFFARLKKHFRRAKALPYILLVFFIAPVWLGTGRSSAFAEDVLTIAVASNALKPMEEITVLFKEKYSVKTEIVSSSTGKLYTQILQGAPYHVFLSADKAHPELLESKNLAEPGTKFVYAYGRLVVWTRKEEFAIAKKNLDFLKNDGIRRIALPNPLTAPFGKAAMEAIKSAGISRDIENKLVYGESVAQAFYLARSGNADAAIVSLSIIYGQKGQFFIVDGKTHSPIEETAIMLKKAPKSAGVFLEFLKSQEAMAVLEKYGYGKPPE